MNSLIFTLPTYKPIFSCVHFISSSQSDVDLFLSRHIHFFLIMAPHSPWSKVQLALSPHWATEFTLTKFTSQWQILIDLSVFILLVFSIVSGYVDNLVFFFSFKCVLFLVSRHHILLAFSHFLEHSLFSPLLALHLFHVVKYCYSPGLELNHNISVISHVFMSFICH